MAGSDEIDEELLPAIATDPEAFREFYLRHIGRIVAFAVRRCRSPDEVPDLVAAVWLEAIASADRFDPRRGHALPWLLGIAANLSASEVRRRSRELEALTRLGGQRVLDEDEYARLEREIDAAAVIPQLREAMARLSSAERPVLELVAWEGLTPTEAAAALGIPPPVARMRLTRARRNLRRIVADDVLEVTGLLPLTEVNP